jgi:hypothetical protein
MKQTDWAATVNALLSQGVTAVQIAGACNTARSTVYHWQSGIRKPDGDNAMLLVALCNKHNIALRTKLRA